jgi:outer membrane receptor for ferrienterochelin and colicin
LNVIYSATKNQNLRFSASQTLNRPEYRELAPFAFYDFNTQFVLSGNDSLQRAKITNADLRYEYFGGNGQMFSATVFYKFFSNPIEQIARPDVLNEISYKNVPNAFNYGIELEFKTNIGSLFKADSSSMWNKLLVYSNLGLIHSVVNVSKNVGTPYESRPLQGQSPYVFNCGVNYQTDNNLSFSLNLNRVGSRIYILGSILQPDIWEKSRTFLDFQVAKTFLNNKLEVKFNIQNILAQNLIFYQNKYGAATKRNVFNKATDYLFSGDATGESRYNKSIDDVVWSTKFGQTFSFVITYKF